MKGYFHILPLLLVLTLNLTAQEMKEEYAPSSVLSSGKWFKIGVTEDGVYRIDFARLRQLGLENPSNPVIFGNNTGQLSFYNDATGPDDLKEVALFAATGGDGVFNEGDYILFYARGTHRWVFNEAGEYDFRKHYYSDTAFYFISSRSGGGKKVMPATAPLSDANFHSSVSDALYNHEIDAENLIKSGREWYQPVAAARDIEIDPGFKNVVTSEPVKYSIRVLARSPVPSSFRFSCSGSLLEDIAVSAINPGSTTGTFAQSEIRSGETLPLTSEPLFTVRFLNNGEISARSWIDYVRLQARTLNTFDGQTTHYSDSKSVAPGIVTEFTIKSMVSRFSDLGCNGSFQSQVNSGIRIRRKHKIQIRDRYSQDLCSFCSGKYRPTGINLPPGPSKSGSACITPGRHGNCDPPPVYETCIKTGVFS